MPNYRNMLAAIIWTVFIGYGLLAPHDANCWSFCPGAHFATLRDGFRYGLPPQIDRGGLVIAKTVVPIQRKDVRDRIVKEINYLLQDRRSRVLVWLARSDSFRPVMEKILRKYDLPVEFLYLPAIESSYNSRALSSAGAYGYWQFIKSTAVCGPSGCPQYRLENAYYGLEG